MDVDDNRTKETELVIQTEGAMLIDTTLKYTVTILYLC